MSYIVFVGYIYRSWLVGPCQWATNYKFIVENPFWWTILWFVLQMAFPLFIIKRCVMISLHSFSLRCVLVSLWSYLCMQPLSGETFTRWCANVEDCARADLQGFWSQQQDVFLMWGCFIPMHPVIKPLSCLLCIESMKREYALRIREVEHGVFTLLFLCLWWDGSRSH